MLTRCNSCERSAAVSEVRFSRFNVNHIRTRKIPLFPTSRNQSFDIGLKHLMCDAGFCYKTDNCNHVKVRRGQLMLHHPIKMDFSCSTYNCSCSLICVHFKLIPLTDLSDSSFDFVWRNQKNIKKNVAKLAIVKVNFLLRWNSYITWDVAKCHRLIKAVTSSSIENRLFSPRHVHMRKGLVWLWRVEWTRMAFLSLESFP